MTFLGYNSAQVTLLLKTAQWIPYFVINPNGSLCCTNPLIIGSLSSFAASSFISPHTQSIPAFSYLGHMASFFFAFAYIWNFFLSIPTLHILLENYSFFRSSTNVTFSEKPLVTQWSKIDHALFCEAIILLLNSTESKALISFLDPLFYRDFLEAGIGSYFCINST